MMSSGPHAAEQVLEHLHRPGATRLGARKKTAAHGRLSRISATAPPSGTTRTPNQPPPRKFMTCEKPSMNGETHAASSVFHHMSMANGSSPRMKIQAPSTHDAAISTAPTTNSAATRRERVIVDLSVRLHRPILSRAERGIRAMPPRGEA